MLIDYREFLKGENELQRVDRKEALRHKLAIYLKSAAGLDDMPIYRIPMICRKRVIMILYYFVYRQTH